jgi:transposase
MLHPAPLGPVPDDTRRVARAAFPTGHPYLTMADELGALFTDEQFAPLFPTHGQPALAPWRLALVSILQFAEGLSDRQAAHAVRSRIDWKYVLRLDLADPGFNASVLSEFRTRLVTGGAAELLLDTLLRWCRERQLLAAHGYQRTDSTHILAAVRALNRIEVVAETMRHALDSLAVAAPAWLRANAPPEWTDRYARRAEEYRLPAGKDARVDLARTIGADGYALFAALDAPQAPGWLRDIPALETLRRVWLQNFYREGDRLTWRTDELGLPPAARFVSSPYDLDAHLGKKGATCWVGYKVSLTETCEADRPNLITHVATTAAPVADGTVTPQVHADLQRCDLLPDVHLVDTGYLDAELMVTSKRDYGVDLVGPARPDVKWQAKEGKGFDAQCFVVDWERQQATCPMGQTSVQWTPAVDQRRNEVIQIRFSTKDCQACPSQSACVRSKTKYPRRLLTVRPKEQYEALRERRARAQTAAYAREYAKRAGIEGTLSQGVRRCRMRRARYIGLARIHLGHLLTATALNFVRIGEWLVGTPRARTRYSAFARLTATAA